MAQKTDRMHKIALERAKARAGKGWGLLGEQFQEALLAREAMMLVLGQAGEKYGPAQELLQRAMGWSAPE